MNTEKEKNYSHSDEFRKRFGERLRKLRIERGYSIEHTHKSLNVPRSTYAGWELGKRVPLSKSLTDLASFLETNVDFLMLNTDNSNVDKNDLKEILGKDYNIVWDGKPLSDNQASTIAAIIEAYLEREQK